MYKKYFGLGADPFSLTPDLGFLFDSIAHKEAIAHLVYGLEQDESIILIVGDIGTGKTLALNRLVAQIPSSFVPVVLNVTALDFEQCLRLFLLKLQVGVRSDMGTAELLNALEIKLKEFQASGRKVLLIIDEAQNLSVETLEGIRLLLNLSPLPNPVLHLVLAGQLSLAETLRSSQLIQLRQRIRVECTLGYLARAEMESYIEHRIRMAGRTKPLFRKGAFGRIFLLSSGVPRLVNLFAGKAMLAAYVDGSAWVEERHVESEGEWNQVPGTPGRPASFSSTGGETELSGPGKTPEREVERTRAELQPGADSSGSNRTGTKGWVHGRTLVRVIVPLALAAALLWFGFLSPEGARMREFLKDGIAEIGEVEGEPREAFHSNPVEGTGDGALAEVSETFPDSAGTGSSMIPTGLSGTLDGRLPPVPVDSLAVASPSGRLLAAPRPQASFLVHVASFSDSARALKFIEELQAEGFESFHRTFVLGSDHPWYRVYLGPFYEEESAIAIAEALKELGIIRYAMIVKEPD